MADGGGVVAGVEAGAPAEQGSARMGAGAGSRGKFHHRRQAAVVKLYSYMYF